jgi:hypothetical protein
MLSLVNLSPRDMSNKSRAFHIEGVRQLIFECKRQARWKKLQEARDLVIAKNARRRHPLRYQEDQIHMTDPYNWRETAALLGQYWAFR